MTRLSATSSLLPAVLPAGCVTAGKGMEPAAPITPVIDPGARKAALARLPATERRRYCLGMVRHAALSAEAWITGPIRRQQSNAQSAGTPFWRLSRAGMPVIREHRNISATRLRKAPESELSRKSCRIPRPSTRTTTRSTKRFQVGNFLLVLAHGYAVLKEEYPGDTELLASVRRWGDRLFELTSNAGDTFGGRSRGIDRRFLIAHGRAHWGNVTGNREALAAAYRYYIRGMSVVGRGGKDRVWRFVHPRRLLCYANMTYGAAMVTACALSRSGAGDVYEVAPGGGSLVEGAAWLWDALLEERPYELMRDKEFGKPGSGLDGVVGR